MMNKRDFFNTVFKCDDMPYKIKSSNLTAYKTFDSEIDVWNYKTCIATIYHGSKTLELNVNYYSSTTQRNQALLIKQARANGYDIVVMGTGQVFEHNDARKQTLALYQ